MSLQVKKKILAVSSSGGHWTQILRLRPAFDGHDVVYVTTPKSGLGVVAGHKIHIVRDINRSSRLSFIMCALHMLLVLLIERPDVVISTGAAPGYLAMRFGKYLGARTLWLESIANSEELSLSTKLVKPYADLLLTQWPHMAREGGPVYKGSVL